MEEWRFVPTQAAIYFPENWDHPKVLTLLPGFLIVLFKNNHLDKLLGVLVKMQILLIMFQLKVRTVIE